MDNFLTYIKNFCYNFYIKFFILGFVHPTFIFSGSYTKSPSNIL